MLRVGIVGTGPWARQAHLPAAQASGRVRLVGVWGRDRAKTGELADEFGIVPFGSFDAMLDAVDVVGFAVSPEVQASLALRAVRAGRHVLLDKPVSTSVAEARELAREVAERGVASAVFFSFGFMDATRRWADRAIDAGGWRYARIESFSSVLTDHANPFASAVWRRQRGALWDIGPHSIALLVEVLGPVASVFATRGPGDLTQVTMAHASGARSVFVAALDAVEAAAGYSAVFVGDGGTTSPPPVDDWDAASLAAYQAALAALADQVEHGAPAPKTDTVFGLHVTEVLDAAERSIRSRAERPV